MIKYEVRQGYERLTKDQPQPVAQGNVYTYRKHLGGDKYHLERDLGGDVMEVLLVDLWELKTYFTAKWLEGGAKRAKPGELDLLVRLQSQGGVEKETAYMLFGDADGIARAKRRKAIPVRRSKKNKQSSMLFAHKKSFRETTVGLEWESGTITCKAYGTEHKDRDLFFTDHRWGGLALVSITKDMPHKTKHEERKKNPVDEIATLEFVTAPILATDYGRWGAVSQYLKEFYRVLPRGTSHVKDAHEALNRFMPSRLGSLQLTMGEEDAEQIVEDMRNEDHAEPVDEDDWYDGEGAETHDEVVGGPVQVAPVVRAEPADDDGRYDHEDGEIDEEPVEPVELVQNEPAEVPGVDPVEDMEDGEVDDHSNQDEILEVHDEPAAPTMDDYDGEGWKGLDRPEVEFLNPGSRQRFIRNEEPSDVIQPQVNVGLPLDTLAVHGPTYELLTGHLASEVDYEGIVTNMQGYLEALKLDNENLEGFVLRGLIAFYAIVVNGLCNIGVVRKVIDQHWYETGHESRYENAPKVERGPFGYLSAKVGSGPVEKSSWGALIKLVPSSYWKDAGAGWDKWVDLMRKGVKEACQLKLGEDCTGCSCLEFLKSFGGTGEGLFKWEKRRCEVLRWLVRAGMRPADRFWNWALSTTPIPRFCVRGRPAIVVELRSVNDPDNRSLCLQNGEWESPELATKFLERLRDLSRKGVGNTGTEILEPPAGKLDWWVCIKCARAFSQVCDCPECGVKAVKTTAPSKEGRPPAEEVKREIKEREERKMLQRRRQQRKRWEEDLRVKKRLSYCANCGENVEAAIGDFCPLCRGRGQYSPTKTPR